MVASLAPEHYENAAHRKPSFRYLEYLSDTKRYPDEALAPYEEFSAGGKIYYFTPGGFLYRKDLRTEEVGGFSCGYLADEAGTIGLPPHRKISSEQRKVTE
ncbi:MAG: hypothetical protein JOZ19_00555 [Rubrobacter sp.]|nr:hypothetical protein [Rubrobacter sp.]